MNPITTFRFGISRITLAFLSLLIIGTSDAAEKTAERKLLRRADSFLGIHFDLHAHADDDRMGARTTPEMVNLVIDKVHPDYIQIDCKGHPGWSSYPTKVGNPVPGFVGDPLRVWRDATRERGVALFMHYSGVIDSRAVELRPEWGVRKADGSSHSRNRTTSVFSSYVDDLMIPQLRELAGEYKVDGIWVDGDCWAVQLDYGKTAIEKFRKASGAEKAPTSSEDPNWHAWRDFNREGFRHYVRHYVDSLKASHPQLQVISNWSFSGHMPEPVSVDVAGLSGDFKPDNSVNSARFQGRCLENQGVAWDLMAWSFSRKGDRPQKTAIQLQQEAAVVLALGGGFQAYYKQDRDGALRDPADMDVMAEVAAFCRERQSFCHRSEAEPQIALLYSRAGHYRKSSGLFRPTGENEPLQQCLRVLVEKQQAVEIVSEHQLDGHMAQWPLIVVPGWEYLEPAFRDQLAGYAKEGGRLLLMGDGPAALFEKELADPKWKSAIVAVPAADDAFRAAAKQLFPNPIIEVPGGAAGQLDVSPRRLNGKLGIHLVNTAGPHVEMPVKEEFRIPVLKDFEVAIRLARKPQSIRQQPEGKELKFSWQDGRATVTVPELKVYSVLVIGE